MSVTLGVGEAAGPPGGEAADPPADTAPADAESTPTKTILERLCPPMPTGGWRGWIGPLIVTAIGLLLRLPNLGTPRAVVFDETYYVKDGLSLLLFGHEHQAVEGADKLMLASTDTDPSALIGLFKDDASFVVHPPVGKWMIGLGEHFFGVDPFGWRISVCVLGILSVLLVARITRRLLRSNLLGTLAGLLVAIDGLSIVMSRTALLDTSLMFFVLVAFGA
ncbi:MAG: phospholipid carrier-dependent glycosyltransferase, partial [Actinomycetes bacterium]